MVDLSLPVVIKQQGVNYDLTCTVYSHASRRRTILDCIGQGEISQNPRQAYLWLGFCTAFDDVPGVK